MRRPSKTKTSQQLQPAPRQPSDVTTVSTDIAAQARHPTPMETEVPARRIVPPILNQPSWRPSRLGSGFAFPFSLAAVLAKSSAAAPLERGLVGLRTSHVVCTYKEGLTAVLSLSDVLSLTSWTF
ncbi:hypothetical protein V8C44DRAFT_339123 [Trichoderma aethiopicum]